jgi:hypothetical protein
MRAGHSEEEAIQLAQESHASPQSPAGGETPDMERSGAGMVLRMIRGNLGLKPGQNVHYYVLKALEERDAALADARRYRWLRASVSLPRPDGWNVRWTVAREGETYYGDRLDAAIDSALSASPEEKI